jgi:hypothetical protein
MPNVLQLIAESIREDSKGGVSAHVYSIESGVVGGALGGAAMVLVAIAYGLLSGRGIWYPVNLIAAVVIRGWQNASPELFTQFNPTGLIFGVTIHLIMSAIIGLLFALLLPTLPGPPFIWAFVVGPVLWFGAYFGVLPLVNPVMVHNIDLPSFFYAHVFYSLVLGWWVQRSPQIKVE